MVQSLDQHVHSRAIRGDIADVASALQSVLGQKVTGMVAGGRDSKAVGKWARGERLPHPEADRRLREALRIAELMLDVEEPSVVRAWFVGLNPMLDDHVPALTIGEDPGLVMRAARNFLATG